MACLPEHSIQNCGNSSRAAESVKLDVSSSTCSRSLPRARCAGLAHRRTHGSFLKLMAQSSTRLPTPQQKTFSIPKCLVLSTPQNGSFEASSWHSQSFCGCAPSRPCDWGGLTVRQDIVKQRCNRHQRCRNPLVCDGHIRDEVKQGNRTGEFLPSTTGKTDGIERSEKS